MSKKNISKMSKHMALHYNDGQYLYKDCFSNDRFFTSDKNVLLGAQGRKDDWVDPRYFADFKNGQLICEDETSTANMPKNPISKSFWR